MAPEPSREDQLASDRETLKDIVAGMDRVQAEVQWALDHFQTKPRGYFTPDEDDRVRQMLLAYRGYRIACYEILDRWRHYPAITEPHLAVEGFVVGYATALVLYAKSLFLIRSFEREPLIRAKINEPDPKLDVPPGFFEEMLAAYSSPMNAVVISRGHLHWIRRRRDIQRLVREKPALYGWIVDLIRKRQPQVRLSLRSALWNRLRYDWRTFLRLLGTPLRQTRWGLQSVVADKCAGAGRGEARAVDAKVIAALRPLLRPGDLLLVRAEGKLTTTLLPGFWAHAAIFLGGPDTIHDLGISEHPFVVRQKRHLPLHAGAFGHVLEAVSPRVAIHPLERCLAADHVVVLRPSLSAEERGLALAEAFGHLGKPYDFEFDFNVSTRVVCTELIYRAFHNLGGIEFQLVKRVGRYTLTGDDMVEQLLAQGREAPFEPVAMLLTDQGGQVHSVEPPRILDALATLSGGWRPMRDPWPEPLEDSRA